MFAGPGRVVLDLEEPTAEEREAKAALHKKIETTKSSAVVIPPEGAWV